MTIINCKNIFKIKIRFEQLEDRTDVNLLNKWNRKNMLLKLEQVRMIQNLSTNGE